MSQDVGITLIRGSVVRVVASVVGMALGFVMMPFMVSHLGSYQYGVYVATTGIVANFYLLDLGFNVGVMRNIAVALGRGDNLAVNRTINSGLVIYTGLALVVALLTLVAALCVPLFVSSSADVRVVQIVIVLTGLNIAIGFPFKSFAGIVQATVRYDLIAATQIATSILSASAIVLLLSAGYGIVAVSIVNFAVGQVNNVAFTTICRHLFPSLRLGRAYVQRAEMGRLTSYSIWAFLIQMGNQLRFGVDSLVVAHLFSASAVTPYYVGARLPDYVSQLFYQATNMTSPVITAMHGAGDAERLRKTVLFLCRLNIVLAVYGIGMISLFARPFLAAWMGPGFHESAYVGMVLMVASMLGFVSNPIIGTAYAMGRLKPVAVATAVEGVTNLVTSLLLGSMLGLIGVAWGTLVPMLFIHVLVLTTWAASLAGISRRELARATLWLLATCGLVMTSLGVLTLLWPSRSAVWLLVAATFVTVGYGLVAVNAGLTRDERGLLARSTPMPVKRLVQWTYRAA